MAERILIVEDEETLRGSLKRVFEKDGYYIQALGSAEDALGFFEDAIFDIVITDIILPGIDGIELLKKIKEKKPEQIVIVVTAYASLDTAVEALRSGAYDYVVKPIIHEEIKQIVINALKQRALQTENQLLKKQIERQYDFSHIIGESAEIKKIIEEAKKIADAKSNVLLLGDTGTGKELIARAIHYNSSRAPKPFIPINCSAIPENLLESELFGHVRGAFTGAVVSKKGLFEEASGGTVFLDEIGDLGTGLQAKLLRVLEDQVIRQVGGTQSVKIDIRFITATNRNLEAAVKQGQFREDLYYRINVVTIKLPPLRGREKDIDLLVKHFMQKFCGEFGKHITEIDEKAMSLLRSYRWPGNIRELQNIIERAVLIAEPGGAVTGEHLPEGIRKEKDCTQEIFEGKLSIEEYTKAFIKRYQTDHTEQQIADMLGITRKSLWEKRKKWGMQK
ncbi:MAG: sigma-54-dependent Fis family transcriptional regulator [Nitrospirae bacterium]|nr:MAG: sigma-54-dependent Fis family transcriptional regulator [Nitrospirota bacterium]